MTDYGRRSGSEPWHPEDPLFGDVYDPGYQGEGYQGQQAYQQPQHPQQYQQQYQQPYPQAQPQQGQDGGWQDPYAAGQSLGGGQQYVQPQQGYGYPQQQYPQQQPQYSQPQYPQQQYPQGQGQQGYDPSASGGYDGYGGTPYQNGGYGHQDPYGARPPQDPYGAQQDYYGQNGYPQQPQQQFPGAGAQGQQLPGDAGQPGRPVRAGQMDQSGTVGPAGQTGPAGAPAGPQQPGRTGMPGGAPAGAPSGRSREPGVSPLRAEPEGTGDWDPDEGDDPGEHAFFGGHDDDDDETSALSSAGRRGAKSRPKGGKKRRSGCACLVVAVVLAGGLGSAVYFGYTFYESHFGPAPDYSGQGTADVQVTVPQGASLSVIGQILKKAGVVKSVDAFSAAADKNPKGRAIQPGVYVLRKQMSAAAAVAMMLDPKSQSALIIPEGMRASTVFQNIDTKLGLKAGTTAAQVKNADLGLPSWAKGNVEGFLFPAKYSAAKGMKPVDVVKQMVARATAQFTRDGLVDGAHKAGKTPLQILTIASLIQAEAQEDQDFGKVSRVVYNRLDQNMALGFDSTINYALGRSTLNTSVKDTRIKSPYNTYDHKGLPPGPIDNPGDQAISAALNPTPGAWLYFVTVKPGDTRFATTDAEHQKNVADFNKYQKEHGE